MEKVRNTDGVRARVGWGRALRNLGRGLQALFPPGWGGAVQAPRLWAHLASPRARRFLHRGPSCRVHPSANAPVRREKPLSSRKVKWNVEND